MRKTCRGAWFVVLALSAVLTGAATAQNTSADQKDNAPQQAGASPQGSPQTPLPVVPAAQSPSQPLTVGQKFEYALYRGFGPGAAVSSFAVGGYQQTYDRKSGYGQGAQGYFSRVGSSYGTVATKHLVGSFALASILRLDPRYHPSGRRSVMVRVGYALSGVLVTRSDNGRAHFNVPAVGGALGAGLISTRWHEPPDRKLRRGLERGSLALGTEALRNIFREFWPDIRRKLRRGP